MAQAIRDLIIYLVFGSFALTGGSFIYTNVVADRSAQNKQDIAVMSVKIDQIYKISNRIEAKLDKIK
jgi:hypothetical protein